MGSSKNCAICLPQQVSPAMLSLILDYCRFHQVLGRSNKVLQCSYLMNYILDKLTQVWTMNTTDYLTWWLFFYIGTEVLWWEIRQDRHRAALRVDICCRQPSVKAIGWSHQSRTRSNNRRKVTGGDTWHISFAWWSYRGVWCLWELCIPIMFSWIFNFHFSHILMIQEEKLEPLRNITDDPRIRLLNRLYAKKRKELKERERIKVLLDFFQHILYSPVKFNPCFSIRQSMFKQL